MWCLLAYLVNLQTQPRTTCLGVQLPCGLGLPTSITKQENAPQAYLQAKLMDAFSQLIFSFAFCR